MKRLLPLGLILCIAPATYALLPKTGMLSGTANGAGPKVRAEVVLESTAVEAGKPFTVGVTLTTNPGYHIYWTNPGESGLATAIKLTLPDGFKAEPAPFPVPMTFVQPGGITGYGYTGATTFLFTVTPPADVKRTGEATLSAAISWLNCNKDACIPGSAKADLPLPFGEAKRANEAIFSAAREALPAGSPPTDLLQKMPQLTTSAHGNSWSYTLSLPWKEAPKGVELYAETVDGLDVLPAKIDSAEGTTTIFLTARAFAGQQVKRDTLPVVIAYTTADGKRRGFSYTLPLPTGDSKPIDGPSTK